MKLKIDWADPVFPKEDVLAIYPGDMDDFYVTATDLDKNNLFFVLLTSFHHYLDGGDREEAAHLSFLMANYLFIALTPPGSCALALHYIEQAIALNPLGLYEEWRGLIEKGN